MTSIEHLHELSIESPDNALESITVSLRISTPKPTLKTMSSQDSLSFQGSVNQQDGPSDALDAGLSFDSFSIGADSIFSRESSQNDDAPQGDDFWDHEAILATTSSLGSDVLDLASNGFGSSLGHPYANHPKEMGVDSRGSWVSQQSESNRIATLAKAKAARRKQQVYGFGIEGSSV